MMKHFKKIPYNTSNGFTLIELMVAIVIVAILATIGFVAYSQVQKSARMSKRIEDLKAIQIALESFKLANGKYPPTGGSWRSECATWGNWQSDEVVQGDVGGTTVKLVPTYMVAFPSDPQLDKAGNKSCYIYASDASGSDYKLMIYDVTEMTYADVSTQRNFIDPKGSSACPSPDLKRKWAIYTNGNGADCW